MARQACRAEASAKAGQEIEYGEGCRAVVRHGRTKADRMFVYVLTSLSFPDCYYVGLTKNIVNRIEQHNAGQISYTSKYRPWKIKNYLWFDNIKKAISFEKYLKSGSGRAFSKKHF